MKTFLIVVGIILILVPGLVFTLLQYLRYVRNKKIYRRWNWVIGSGIISYAFLALDLYFITRIES